MGGSKARLQNKTKRKHPRLDEYHCLSQGSSSSQEAKKVKLPPSRYAHHSPTPPLFRFSQFSGLDEPVSQQYGLMHGEVQSQEMRRVLKSTKTDFIPSSRFPSSPYFESTASNIFPSTTPHFSNSPFRKFNSPTCTFNEDYKHPPPLVSPTSPPQRSQLVNTWSRSSPPVETPRPAEISSHDAHPRVTDSWSNSVEHILDLGREIGLNDIDGMAQEEGKYKKAQQLAEEFLSLRKRHS